MSVSFHKMWMLLELDTPEDDASNKEGEDGHSPLLTSGEESTSFRAIRNGMNLRSKDCGDFWDDFIKACSDSEGMAELLEVPKEKISGWASKIKEILSKVEQQDSQDKDAEGRSEMIPTDKRGPTADHEERGITYGPPDLRPTP